MPSALHASRRKGSNAVIAAAALAAATISGFSRCARAADFTWVPTAGGAYDWGTAANWNPSGVPANVGDSANLSVGITGNQTISLNAAFAIATLSLGSTAAPITTDLTNAGAGNLLFEGNGGTTTLLSGGVGGAVNQISVPILLDSLTQLDGASTNDLTIAGPLTNSGANRNLNNLAINKVLRITGQVNLSEVGAGSGRALSLNRDTNTDVNGSAIREFGDILISGNIVDGPGGPSSLGLGPIGTVAINRRSTITLSGNNTFSGGVNANRVNIVLGSNTALGTGTFTPNSSTGAFGPSVLSNDDARTIANTVQFSQFWTVQGEHSLSFSGPVVQANNRAIVNLLPAGKTLTMNDVYGANSPADTRTFVVDGPGRTIINGNVLGSTAATWTGTTLFEKRGTGTVTINGTAPLGTLSYNGGTRIRSGLLEFSQALAYGNTVGMTVEAGGAVGLLSGSTDATFLSRLATGGGAGPSNIGAASLASNGALALAPGDAAVNLNFQANLGQAGTNLQTMGVGAVSGGVTYTGTITPFNNTYKLGGGASLTLPNPNQLTGANGVLADNGGTVVINGSNDYTGVTKVGGNYVIPTQGLGALAFGTLLLNAPNISVRVNSTLAVNSLAAGGANSSIGSSSNAPSNLVIDGGTLQYVGSGGSTDRQFSVGPNGAVVDSSGTGPLTFSSAAAITQLDAADRAGTLANGTYFENGVSSGVPRVIWLDNVSDLTVGMSISSAALGIPAGTTIIGLNPPSYGNWGQTSSNGPYQILLSQTPSSPATTTGTVSFGDQSRTVTLAGTNTGNNTVSGALTDSAGGTVSLAKKGSGKWVMSGSNTYTGLTTISAGTLVLAGNAKNPVLSGVGADLQGGRLVLDYNDTGVAPNVKSILTAGYGQNPKFSSGPIRTTSATNGDKGLGWKDDSAAKQVTVGYTWYGDTNLDGQVDVTDLGSLATNWQTSNVWAGGDFNYDGFVDVTDLGSLATNWQKGVGNPLARQSLQDAMETVGLGGVTVPEPTTLGLLGLCVAGVLARRGRR